MSALSSYIGTGITTKLGVRSVAELTTLALEAGVLEKVNSISRCL